VKAVRGYQKSVKVGREGLVEKVDFEPVVRE